MSSQGPESAVETMPNGLVMYAADLTEHYVDFNKGDVTDPTTLGG